MNIKHMLNIIHRMNIVMIEKVKILYFLRLKRFFLVPVDELLWSSSSLNDSDNENIDEYLKTIHTECKYIYF